MEQLFSLELAGESVSYLSALIALLKANKPRMVEFGCDSDKTQIRAHFRAADLGPDIFPIQSCCSTRPSARIRRW